MQVTRVKVKDLVHAAERELGARDAVSGVRVDLRAAEGAVVVRVNGVPVVAVKSDDARIDELERRVKFLEKVQRG